MDRSDRIERASDAGTEDEAVAAPATRDHGDGPAVRPNEDEGWQPFSDLGFSNRDRLFTALSALGLLAISGYVVLSAIFAGFGF